MKVVMDAMGSSTTITIYRDELITNAWVGMVMKLGHDVHTSKEVLELEIIGSSVRELKVLEFEDE